MRRLCRQNRRDIFPEEIQRRRRISGSDRSIVRQADERVDVVFACHPDHRRSRGHGCLAFPIRLHHGNLE